MSTLQNMTMYNPFELINRAFADDYRVNLCVAGLDGSIMLTLSDASGIVAKHLIAPAQRNDPRQLQRLVEGIQLELATAADDSAAMLASLAERLPPPPTHLPRPSAR
ncbi:DUF3509 domain-containing protein [Pseudomonas phoenicis]|uniref:DUF3509 domain-containing protein n=1 Tax=unclassified Pseudomonas TaxID=196821 RepID=UPI00399F87CE